MQYCPSFSFMDNYCNNHAAATHLGDSPLGHLVIVIINIGSQTNFFFFFFFFYRDFCISFFYQLTPLHVAAEGGRVDTVCYLVDKGAVINIKDHHWVKDVTIYVYY